MIDAPPRPPIQAVKPPRRRPQPHQTTAPKGKPIGHGSGRAVHSLKPHVDEKKS